MRPRHDSGTNVDQQAPASAVSDSTKSAPVTGPGDDDVTISTSAIDDDSISDILEASPRDLRESVVRFDISLNISRLNCMKFNYTKKVDILLLDA